MAKHFHEYSTTQYNLQQPLKARILELAAGIPDEDLYIEDDDPSYGRTTEPHITLKYGLETDDPDLVEEQLKDTAAAVSCFSPEGASLFTSDEQPYDVVKINIVVTKELQKIHDVLSELPNADSHPKYIAHTTIAYVKKGRGKKYEGLSSISKSVIVPFVVNQCVFRNRNNESTVINLAQRHMQQASSDLIAKFTDITMKKGH